MEAIRPFRWDIAGVAQEHGFREPWLRSLALELRSLAPNTIPTSRQRIPKKP